MRSRSVRLSSGLLALASIAGAAAFIAFGEQHIARRRDAERAFSGAVGDVVSGLGEVRLSQAAYVATGQDVAFWAPKASAAAESLVSSVTLLRSRATTDAGRAALDAAGARAAEFAGIDRRAREYLEQNMHYYMDQSCIDGLVLFYEKAARLGAIKGPRGLEFV